MLRFLSRRRARSVSGQTASQIKNQRLPSNKNVVQCRVVLLDGTDLPIELSVSRERGGEGGGGRMGKSVVVRLHDVF